LAASSVGINGVTLTGNQASIGGGLASEGSAPQV